MRINDFTIPEGLLYRISPEQIKDQDLLLSLLEQHPEIRFVSLVAVDIAGNDTDEKIPVSQFVKNVSNFLNGSVQTDGSSVVLPEIATINNAKVELVADKNVHWLVDYNYENLNNQQMPCGTLRIPAFLRHNGVFVCSRSLLARATQFFAVELRALLTRHPAMLNSLGYNAEDIADIVITTATELECWVRTPDDTIYKEQLSTSQGLKEQYWKRTKGIVRTAMEQAITLLENYGFRPEMAHKEVGGVKAHLTGKGTLDHIMEQLEFDWEYAEGLQAADNELMIRILIKEVFRLHGLEASFRAKPVPGVAGNGEHLHLNATAILKSGKRLNLFAPSDFNTEYLSPVGWGALMGLLHHYNELLAPFVTCSNDAFNRLKPGFEAPTHAVSCIGTSPVETARNRTVLIGLIRNVNSPHATRFELRSPNPHTNLYFTIAASCQLMLDGITYALLSEKNSKALEAEFVNPKEIAEYLSPSRLYRSEKDIFTALSEDERNSLFGKPASNVYETLANLINSDYLEVLYHGNVFSEIVLRSYMRAMLNEWELELRDRLLGECRDQIALYKMQPPQNALDDLRWHKIENMRQKIAKSNVDEPCLLERLHMALKNHKLSEAASLQTEVNCALDNIETLYQEYRRNFY